MAEHVQSCLTLCNPMDLCPWDFPGENTGVYCHFLLQGIFLAQGSNPQSPALAGKFFTTKSPGKPILGSKYYSVQFSSVAQLYPTLCNPMDCSMPGFLGSLDSKEFACNAGDLGSIPGSGRSPGEGSGNPLQYSRLGNPMDRGAWRATVHGVAKA